MNYLDFLKDNFPEFKGKPIFSLCNKHGQKFYQAGYVLWPCLQKEVYMIAVIFNKNQNENIMQREMITSFPMLENFTLYQDKMNLVFVSSIKRAEAELEAIYEVNFKPIEQKNEFTQLFKQPTKRKELCL